MKLTYVFCFLLPLLNKEICYSTEDGSAYGDLRDFTNWSVKYNKTYYGKTDLSRQFAAWRTNRDYIDRHNSKDLGFQMELNRFGDIPRSEWLHRHGYNHRMNSKVFPLPVEEEQDASLPESVDWRKKGLVTGIKNQLQCGSCWAFSAVGSMEGQHAKKTGKLVSLSESQIVDCDVNGTDGGCSGGWMDGAFQYVINQTGIEPENDYPYVPIDGNCTFNKSEVAATFSGFQDVTGGEAGLKKAVANVGPVSVAIDASGSGFQFYKSGVFYDPTCSSQWLDHGVLAVGYGTTKNGTDYWIVKNSWGETWGDKGYILMARNRNNSCGIASKPSYPIV